MTLDGQIKTAELGPTGQSWANPDLAKQEMDWAAQRRAAAPVLINPITGAPMPTHVKPKEGTDYLWAPKPGLGPVREPYSPEQIEKLRQQVSPYEAVSSPG